MPPWLMGSSSCTYLKARKIGSVVPRVMDGGKEIAFGKKGHSWEIESRLRQRRSSEVKML